MSADENIPRPRSRAEVAARRGQPQPGPELVVFSHLRWVWVWQRPQHIISRLAAQYERVVFVEEPIRTSGLRPTLATERTGDIERIWLELPGESEHCGFDHPDAAMYADLLAERLGDHHDRTLWLYTPLALAHAHRLRPRSLAFDVMDDLSSFAAASPAVTYMHERALRVADVVYTGGRSLQRRVATIRPDAQCCPSGVELEHYEVARRRRAELVRTRPVAGYIGVIDERIDLDLLGELADVLHDWDVQVVGPTAKIDPAALPERPNLSYLGPRPYAELPELMAGFDVALMPFALNAATRSISPTKTMEYLAAGLPVVSTRVPDVVADFSGIVVLADDARGFADACRRSLSGTDVDHGAVASILRWNHWDAITERMYERLAAAAADGLARAERS